MNGMIFVAMTDCMQTGAWGSSINLTPPSGEVTYLGEKGLPDSSLTESSTLGIGLVTNVTPGATQVGALHMGTEPFEAHTVGVRSSLHPSGESRAEITFTNLHP
jgi:hypothetical protein